MNKHVHVFSFALTVASVACGGAPSRWDPQASAALRLQPEVMLRDLDTGNFDDLLARIDDDSIVLDLDENNRPVRYEGRAKVTAYFRGLERGAKAQGLTFETKITRNDCSATTAVGYCVVEFDQKIAAGGRIMGPFKFRATTVSRKVGSEWRLAHWHGSFRDLPSSNEPPSTNAATK